MKIDLTKSQLILEDVKVRVWMDDEIENKGYLAVIDHRSEYPFAIWDDKRTAKYHNYDYFCICCWKHAELIPEPEYMSCGQVRDFCRKYQPIVRFSEGHSDKEWNNWRSFAFTEPMEYYEYAIPIVGEVFTAKKFLKGGEV